MVIIKPEALSTARQLSIRTYIFDPACHAFDVQQYFVQSNWSEALPFIQLTYNTSFSTTIHKTPFFLMFGRQSTLPFDIISVIPHVSRSTTTEEFAHFTREIAFELARRKPERNGKHKAVNSKLPQIHPWRKRTGIQTSSKYRWIEPKAYSAMARGVYSMFQIIFGLLSTAQGLRPRS